MRVYLAIVAFFFLAGLLPARAGKIDSTRLFNHIQKLEKQAPAFQRDTLLVHAYADAAFYYLHKDSRFLEEYAQKALRLAQKNNWKKGKVIAYYALGYSYLHKVDYDALMAMATEIYLLSEKENLPIYSAHSARFMGLCYTEYTRWNVARWDSARNYYNKALKIYKEVGKDGLVAEGYVDIANSYRDRDQYTQALYYYRQAYKHYDQAKDDYGKAEVLRCEGFMLVRKKQFREALVKFHTSLEIVQKLESIFGMMSVYNDIANAYYYTQEYDKAIIAAKKALSLSQVYHSKKESNWALMTLFRSHKGLGKLPEALEALEKVTYDKRETQENNVGRQFSLHQLLFDNQQEDVEIQRKIIEKQEATQKFLIGFSILILFVMVLLWWNNNTLRRKNAEIREALVKGQTLERKRVAAQLHDNLGSTISTINWYLYGLDKGTLSQTEKDIYEGVQQMVQRAYEEVRSLSHNLLPKELEKDGLRVALQKLGQKLNENGSIRFRMEIDGFEERLDRKTEFEMYSMIQELATNIIKHSRATQAIISLHNNEEQITLQVEDNGEGLKSSGKEGVGLSNVRSRVGSLRGTLRIADKKERGTCIQVQIPHKVFV
ncbi:tetratricopeptide repeat protein [Telluribacter sp.]|jgi:signal transduction histidine kinase|uniref:ATP-binding protein n=1 Tax=Telluribacter sp. TaxID=1978767 RepID=UPI002E0F26AD|nr:tetratricopeptide repeat protein [Telluribacter sp.]